MNLLCCQGNHIQRKNAYVYEHWAILHFESWANANEFLVRIDGWVKLGNIQRLVEVIYMNISKLLPVPYNIVYCSRSFEVIRSALFWFRWRFYFAILLPRLQNYSPFLASKLAGYGSVMWVSSTNGIVVVKNLQV
jgi:hypothetical protein